MEELPTKTPRDCSTRAVGRACVMRAEKLGELVEDGIEIIIPSRTGAELAHMSQPTFSKRMKDLEEAGLIRRIEVESSDLAYAYVLKVPGGVTPFHHGTTAGESNTSYKEVYRGENAPLFTQVPRRGILGTSP